MTQAFKQNNKEQNFIIRLAHLNDMPQIITTQVRSLKVLAHQDYQPRELQALLASKYRRRSKFETIFVAEIATEIVGFAALDRYTNSLAGLFINPDYARRGIGTRLLKRVEKEAVKLRIPILWVCASLTGHPFYLANKYQELRATSISLNGIEVPCIQMKKRLLTPTKAEKIQETIYQSLIWMILIWSLITMILKM